MTAHEGPLRPADLDLFDRVVFRLREAVSAYANDPENLFVLDSVIKRFELTFELANRSLTRYLLDRAGSQAEIRSMSYQGQIRLADDLGLLKTGWPQWKRYRNARNRTVHEYYEESAREIAKDAGAFLEEASFLLDNLKRSSAEDE